MVGKPIDDDIVNALEDIVGIGIGLTGMGWRFVIPAGDRKAAAAHHVAFGNMREQDREKLPGAATSSDRDRPPSLLTRFIRTLAAGMGEGRYACRPSRVGKLDDSGMSLVQDVLRTALGL